MKIGSRDGIQTYDVRILPQTIVVLLYIFVQRPQPRSMSTSLQQLNSHYYRTSRRKCLRGPEIVYAAGS